MGIIAPPPPAAAAAGDASGGPRARARGWGGRGDWVRLGVVSVMVAAGLVCVGVLVGRGL